MAKILIADDDLDTRTICMRSLKMFNHEIAEAASKNELMTQVEQFAPDVILLDVMFGTEDGREICYHIKQQYPNTKVILVSAREDLLADYSNFSADHKFSKPFRISNISNKVDELVSSHT